MLESLESVRWNACMHRLDLSLYSHSKEFVVVAVVVVVFCLFGWCFFFFFFLRNGVGTHVNSKGKIPFTGGSEEDQTHNAASCRTASPTHYR